MAWRKLHCLILLVVCLLVASPVAADDGKVDLWSGIWRSVVAFFAGGEEASAGSDPAEATADDMEIVPCVPVGG
jgi:hypothetical protein